jgi:hypothetical protein
MESSSLCLYSSNLGTFWLKIEQFWPFEEISIFSNGGHLGYRTALTDTILKGEKRGDEIKKKSSLKLLSQSQPNSAEMILRWSPFKIVSVSAVLGTVSKMATITKNRNFFKVKISKSSKFFKNPVIYVKKLIIMLIQFKFGHFLA